MSVSKVAKNLMIGESSQLPYLCGGVSSVLNAVLIEKKICKQTYHKKSFTGNHCHKYLKRSTAYVSPPQQDNGAKQLTFSKKQNKWARHSKSSMHSLPVFAAKFHTADSKPVDEKSKAEANKCIKDCMLFYRPKFLGAPIIPKQHRLEAHCIPFIFHGKKQHRSGTAQEAGSLVSWYFEPSQPQRITSGLNKLQFLLFTLHTGHQTTNSLKKKKKNQSWHKFTYNKTDTNVKHKIFKELVPSVLPLSKQHIRLGHAGIVDHSIDLSTADF